MIDLAGGQVATTRRARRTQTLARLWAISVVMMIAAGVLSTTIIAVIPAAQDRISAPIWFLAALFFLAETNVVRIHARRVARTFSLNEIPLVVAMFYASGSEVLLALFLGMLVALTVHRRQARLRLVFNLAHFTLGGAGAIVVFSAVLGSFGGELFGPAGWIAALAGVLFASTTSVLATHFGLSIAEGQGEASIFGQLLGYAALGAVVNLCLGLVGVTLVWFDPRAAWLIGVPIVAVFLAYRAYERQRQRHEGLEFLYTSTRILANSDEVGDALVNLLEQARATFRAEMAEVLLVPEDGEDQTLVTRVARDGPEAVMEPAPHPERHRPLRQAASAVGPHLLDARKHAGGLVGAYLRDRDIEDLMVAPLKGERSTLGIIMIGNRIGDVTTFDGEDLRLFETLAYNASVSLENGQLDKTLRNLTELKDELRHRAYHDPLTGLGNRTLFIEQVEAAVGERASDAEIAVMFLDLDDFKTINDSLGHEAGDELLQTVAGRVRNSLRPNDVPARLGGDEFAILLHELDDPRVAVDVAERIKLAMKSPFRLGDDEVFVHASVGIAMSSAETASASELLRNADVAMYDAKSKVKGGYAMFEPGMAEAAIERLNLKAELARAVDSGEFDVSYQPVLDLRSGAIVGAEALLRWSHPERGTVAPAEFLELAEDTGLIVPIGSGVLRQACREISLLRKETRLPLTLGVNLSLHQLRNQVLVSDVAESLQLSGLPAQALVLEIAESDIMMDPDATIETLDRLKALGVQLAIDDFGTGYSSLSYLHRFPIDTIKVARTFVRRLAEGGDDAVLARAVIELAHTMGLAVVAEGVEVGSVLQQLKELGCEYGQGYHLAGVLPLEELRNLFLPGPDGNRNVVPFPA